MATIKNPHSHICLEMIKIKTPKLKLKLQQLGRDHNSFFTRVEPNFSPIILDFQNPSSKPSGRMQAASVVVQLDQALASSMIVQLEVRQTDDNDDNYIHDDNVILWSCCRRHLPQGLAWVLQQRRHTGQSLRLDSDDCNDKTTNIVCEDYICRKSSDNINKSRWCLLYLLIILSLQARTPIRAPVQLLAGITTPRNLAEVRSNWWWWPGWDDAKDLLIMQAPCRHQGHPGQPSTLRSTLPMPRQDSDDDDDKTTNIVGEDYICINLFDVMTMIKTQILLMFSIFDDCRLQPLRECSSWTARAQTRGTWTSSSPSLFKLRQNSRGPFRACPRNIYKKTWPHIYKKWSLQFLSNNICRLSCNWHFSLKTWPHIYKKWSLQFVSSNICRFSCNWHFL